MTGTSSTKHILQKGAACSTCKARKVRCDAVSPACGACRRSARFRGDDPTLVVCSYTAARRCGPAPASSAVAARVKETKARIIAPINPVAVKAVSSDALPVAARGASDAFPVLCSTSSPASFPRRPPTPRAGAYASTLTSVPSTSTLPAADVPPPHASASRRFVLPAPIPLHASASQPPPLMDQSSYPAALQYVDSDAGALQPPLAMPVDLSALPLFDTTYPYFATTGPASSAASAESRAPSLVSSTSPSSPAEEPHGGFVSSPASLESFAWSGDLSTPSSMPSLIASPFSIYDDLDYALAAITSDLPPLVMDLPATPAYYSPLDPFTAAFGDYDLKRAASLDSVFLPSAHDGQATLALPLFGH